jgi:hypothetical protein
MPIQYTPADPNKYNPENDPINIAVNTKTTVTHDSNITDQYGIIKPNLENFDTSKPVDRKGWETDQENKRIAAAKQAGKEYAKKQAKNPLSSVQNPISPGFQTDTMIVAAGQEQIREEQQIEQQRKREIDIEREMNALETEYGDNNAKLMQMSGNRETWNEKDQSEYASLLQRQAKIEVDAPAVALGMNRRQYDAFQAGRELIKENPLWSYADALGAGGVRLITSPYTLLAPGSELADVNRYVDQGIGSEGKIFGNIVRGTLASMPTNVAMFFAPGLAVPLTFTDITSSNIKDYYDENTLDAGAIWASALSGGIQTIIEYGMDTKQLNMYRNAYKQGGMQGMKDAIQRVIKDTTAPGFSKAARTIGAGTLTEASEEVLQNVSDKITRHIVNGDPMPQTREELLAYGNELAMDAVGGAFGGFVLGSIGTGISLKLHQNTIDYIKYNAKRYDSVEMLLQTMEQINAGQYEEAQKTFTSATAQAKIDQISAKPLMRGFKLANDALNMAKAQQALAIKIENESLAEDIRNLTSQKNDLVRQGHEPGFETPEAEKLYTVEEQIKIAERKIKKNIKDLQDDKDKGKIVELFEMAKELQGAGIADVATGLTDTATNVYQGIQERGAELNPGESRSIEEDNAITQGIADKTNTFKDSMKAELEQINHASPRNFPTMKCEHFTDTSRKLLLA